MKFTKENNIFVYFLCIFILADVGVIYILGFRHLFKKIFWGKKKKNSLQNEISMHASQHTAVLPANFVAGNSKHFQCLYGNQDGIFHHCF